VREPEHQLSGALMWLTAEQIKPILEPVVNTQTEKRMWPMAFANHPPPHSHTSPHPPTRCASNSGSPKPATLSFWGAGR
jgi:hypothetical protein